MQDRAKTPRAARERYARILQLSLSCLGSSHVWYFGQIEDDDGLFLNNDPITLRRNGKPSRLYLSATQRFRIIPDPRDGFEGEYKAQTLAYIYSVSTTPEADDEVFAWHWHPVTTPNRTTPHMHVRIDHRELGVAIRDLHVPSGRVSFEYVVAFLIEELGVREGRNDWREVLTDAHERFSTFRTWS